MGRALRKAVDPATVDPARKRWGAKSPAAGRPTRWGAKSPRTYVMKGSRAESILTALSRGWLLSTARRVEGPLPLLTESGMVIRVGFLWVWVHHSYRRQPRTIGARTVAGDSYKIAISYRR